MSVLWKDCSRQFLRNKGSEPCDHVLGPSEVQHMYQDLAAIQNQWGFTEDKPDNKGECKWATACLCFVDPQMGRHSTQQGANQLWNTNLWLKPDVRGDYTPQFPETADPEDEAIYGEYVKKALKCKILSKELMEKGLTLITQGLSTLGN